MHSDLGDGLATPEEILDAAERAGLDVIALTDHDDIRGSFLLRDLAARRDSALEIVTGVEVTTLDGVKPPFAGVTLPPKTYAVFPHRGHVTKLNETVDAAWKWLPQSDRQLDQSDAQPTFIERYGERFDPKTGYGDIEVWFPVKG